MLMLKEDLRRLVANEAQPCVSLYAPMEGSGPATRQNRIRFKNVLARAQERLTERGFKSDQIVELLETARARVDERDFWQHQSGGLAVFCSPGLCREYRVPLKFEELAIVGHRFHVKPLMPLLSGDGRFFILALARDDVRLFDATHDTIHEIRVLDMPRSLAEALRVDELDKGLQFHTRTAPAGPGGMRSAIFHGHGAESDLAVEKKRYLEYFRLVDKALHDVLRDSNAPLVLAGVDYYLPIYREANTYPHLMDTGVPGSADSKRKTPQQLREAAWAIVEPKFTADQKQAIARCGEAKDTPRGSNRLDEILPAAHTGRVETLLVEVGRQVWGSFQPESGQIQINTADQNGAEDLLNRAAIEAYVSSGGSVYALPRSGMPDESPIAAVFRY